MEQALRERSEIEGRVETEIKGLLAILKSKAPSTVTKALQFSDDDLSAIDILIETILDLEDEAKTPHFAGAYAAMRDAVREGECGYSLDYYDDLERDS